MPVWTCPSCPLTGSVASIKWRWSPRPLPGSAVLRVVVREGLMVWSEFLIRSCYSCWKDGKQFDWSIHCWQHWMCPWAICWLIQALLEGVPGQAGCYLHCECGNQHIWPQAQKSRSLNTSIHMGVKLCRNLNCQESSTWLPGSSLYFLLGWCSYPPTPNTDQS